jgi:hypothetical protein
MAQTLDSTSIAFSVGATANNQFDLNKATAPLTYAKSFGWTTGAGASQADRAFADTRTIAPSGTDDLDLTGTALQDILNVNLALVRVKLIAVFAYSANTNNVVIGAAAATQFVGPFGANTHTIAIPPGGVFMVSAPTAAGWTVGAGASDLLRVANSGAGTSVTYDIIILGSST